MNIKQNNSGFVLFAVVIMAALGGIMAAALLYGTSSQITRASQEIRYEKAFFIAEAGIELAKARLRSEGAGSFSAETNFGGGQVRYRTIMTTPTNPVIIWSTGTYETVSRALEVGVLVEENDFPPPSVDGAAGIYGTNTSLALGGSSLIDGRDYSLPPNFDCNGIACSGAVTTNPAVPGVFSTESPSMTGTNRITGGIITNGTSQFTNSTYWQDQADALIPQATITLPGGTYSSTTDLGTRTSPQITVATGDTTLTSDLDGAGILIVMDDVNLTFSGNFHYEGIVILMGNNTFTVTGTARLFGALVTSSEGVNISINGNPEILYSSQALANLQNLPLDPQPLSVTFWREVR